MSDNIFKETLGEQATFVVHVQLRQNATWQGTIQWLEEEKTQKFRSVLEMLKLMDQALQKEQPIDENETWEILTDKAI